MRLVEDEDRPSWFSRAVDRLILACAIAGMSDGNEVVDPDYADGMLVVFDEWLNRDGPDCDSRSILWVERRFAAHHRKRDVS